MCTSVHCRTQQSYKMLKTDVVKLLWCCDQSRQITDQFMLEEVFHCVENNAL